MTEIKTAEIIASLRAESLDALSVEEALAVKAILHLLEPLSPEGRTRAVKALVFLLAIPHLVEQAPEEHPP